MNRSLASSKAAKVVSKAVKAGSKAAADSRSRVSRVKSPDRVASKSRDKADRVVASAKTSAGSYDRFFPGLGRGFFSPGIFSAREDPSSSRDARRDRLP
jgi:hypothetical protein